MTKIALWTRAYINLINKYIFWWGPYSLFNSSHVRHFYVPSRRAIRFAHHYISLFIMFLLISENLVFLSSLYLVSFIKPELIDFVKEYDGLILLYLFIMTLCIASQGLYRIRERLNSYDIVLRLAFSFLIGFAGFVVVTNYLSSYRLPENIIFALSVSHLVSFVFLSWIHPYFFKHIDKTALKSRVLVLGAGNRAAKLMDLKRKSDLRNVRILGFVKCHGDSFNDKLPNVLNLTSDELGTYVTQQRIDEIIVASDDRRIDFPVLELLKCKVSGVNIIDLICFFEREIGKIRIDLLYPSWLIFADGFTQNCKRVFLKKAIDICFSLLLIAGTLPIMLITALAIFLESKGGIFYWQTRVGLNGKLFKIIKFRSMIPDAEKGHAQWATDQDHRVTRVGRIIRKYRIDELPQLFNVLIGDMSLVGPRPERPEFINELSECIPYYNERHRVKPGLAGWAQLNYPYAATLKDSFNKLEYDLYYVKNNNVIFDFIILVETFEVILFKKGSR